MGDILDEYGDMHVVCAEAAHAGFTRVSVDPMHVMALIERAAELRAERDDAVALAASRPAITPEDADAHERYFAARLVGNAIPRVVWEAADRVRATLLDHAKKAVSR